MLLWSCLGVLLLSLFPVGTNGDAMACKYVQIEATVARNSDNAVLIAWQGAVTLDYFQQRHNISVSTQFFNNTAPIATNAYEIYPDLGEITNCHAVENQSCSTILANTTFSMNFPLKIDGKVQRFSFFDGIVDSGAFSLFNGNLFQPNCYGSQLPWMNDYTANVWHCCMNYSPETVADITYPRCSLFTSRVLHYAPNFQSVVSTMTANFAVSGNGQIQISGTFNGTENVASSYRFAQNYENNVKVDGAQGSFNLTTSYDTYEGKYLFVAHRLHSQSDFGLVVGRLLVRDSKFLMEEGVEFAPDDACDYFSARFADGSVGTAEFCCKQFSSQ